MPVGNPSLPLTSNVSQHFVHHQKWRASHVVSPHISSPKHNSIGWSLRLQYTLHLFEQFHILIIIVSRQLEIDVRVMFSLIRTRVNHKILSLEFVMLTYYHYSTSDTLNQIIIKPTDLQLHEMTENVISIKAYIFHISGQVTLEYDQRSKIWIIISPLLLNLFSYNYTKLTHVTRLHDLSSLNFHSCDSRNDIKDGKYDSHILIHFPSKYKCVTYMKINQRWPSFQLGTIILFRYFWLLAIGNAVAIEAMHYLRITIRAGTGQPVNEN